MDVSSILAVMGALSLGHENIVPKENELFLLYLNLAHQELYQATASLNPFVMKKQTFPTQGGSIIHNKPFFLVLHVEEQRGDRPIVYQPLSPRDALDPAKQRNVYVMGPSETQLQLFKDRADLPDDTNFTVLWVPSPPELHEDDDEEDIPYPSAFHPVLVDGALYYLFLDVGGFKSSAKEQEAKARFEMGKRRLIMHFSGTESLSTFSPV